MANKESKTGTHFSLEPLVHEAGTKAGIHISADTKRVGLVIILAVASFLTVYFLSGSADNTKTQLRFADDGSTAPAAAATPAATATPLPVQSPSPTSPGSLAYNGFPDLAANGNQNGIASTVIRNSASTNGNANTPTMAYNANTNGMNANGTYPTSGNVPPRVASPTPMVTAPYPTPTPTPNSILGQYGVIGSAGEDIAPTPTPYPSPSPSPSTTPTPVPSPSPSAEPIKRGMQQSGPAAWMALLPVLMVGVFRFARNKA